MKTKTKITLYTLFTLLAVLVFLYVRFPAATVMELTATRISHVDPLLQIDARTVRPTLNAGLQFRSLAVSYNDIPIYTFDRFNIRPDLFALLKGYDNFDFSAPVGGGDLKGRLEMQRDTAKPQTRANINLAGAAVESFDLLQRWSGYQPGGSLNAHLDFDTRKSGDGTGKLNIEIIPARVSFAPPFLGMEQIDFTQIQAEVNLSTRMLFIRRIEAYGSQIEGRANGTILMRNPLGDSRVTLICTVKPQPGFVAEHKNDILGGLLSTANASSRGMVFRIAGTLDNPSYVMR